MLDGLALTSGELTDVARVLMNGLSVHAKESEEVFNSLNYLFFKVNLKLFLIFLVQWKQERYEDCGGNHY